MSHFSHIDAQGKPSMVDVSAKTMTERKAIAESRVWLPPNVLEVLKDKEIHTKKGPVFQTAIIAGIMAVKRCAELIPLCHPLPIQKCDVQIELEGHHAVVSCMVKTAGKTGVEMEALTGASIAALTIYDMCKAMSHDIKIEMTQLIHKSGGKRDFDRHG